MTKTYSKVLCTVLAIAMLVGVQIPLANAASVSFDDVPASHWAYEAINTCVSKGINTGMGDNKFAPDSNLTYAQFVTMLVNAFYKDEELAYERDNSTKMDDYYDHNPQWWSYKTYFFSNKALFKVTYGNAASSAMMNSNVNRYEMAQFVANILNDKSFTVPEVNKTAVQGRITDWTNVPSQYRDAVSTSFGLGILNGFEDGSFGGTSYLTRAQACVVMTKLDNTIQNGPQTPSTPSTPSTPTVPETPPTSTEDIKVTESNGAYTIADNGFATGYLNNGKPITEANVLALLEKAETIWPNGMKWAERTETNNHWYATQGVIVQNALTTKYGTSTNYACGGYAAMISDYLFGKNNNPVRQVTDMTKIRPGDIIVMMKNGKLDHVMIAASSSFYFADYGVADAVWVTDGNTNDQVNWPNPTQNGARPDSVTFQNKWSSGTTWEVWSRYPSGGASAPGSVESKPPVTGEKDITISTTSNGRGYFVADNGFGTGTLNNGKPVTEDNVIALLKKAEGHWPTGMTWDENTTTTYYYETVGNVTTNLFRGRVNANYGCGGYAAMISDYLFGKSNNPVHQVTSVYDIRPGDIVVMIKNGKADHVFVATSRTFYSSSFGVNDAVRYTDGNDNDKVYWCDPNVDGEMNSLSFSNKWASTPTTWEIWSRYPA